ncbi:MAG: hypothetical protein RL215_1130 [Planctomycetota bacterium]|jgi:hypothetical protein
MPVVEKVRGISMSIREEILKFRWILGNSADLPGVSLGVQESDVDVRGSNSARFADYHESAGSRF